MTITKDNSSFFKIKDCLPIQVSSALTRLDKSTLDKICEIRLRDGGITTITIEDLSLKSPDSTLCGSTFL